MVMKIQLVEKKRAGFPVNFKFSKTFWRTTALIRSDGIAENVLAQRQGGGSRIKPNPQAYRQQKLDRGFGGKSLIAEKKRFTKKRFKFYKVMSFLGTDKKLRGVVIGPVSDQIRKMVLGVQKHGYIGWLSRSRDTNKKMREHMRKEIRNNIRAAIRDARKARLRKSKA